MQTQTFPKLITEMKHGNSVKAINQIAANKFQVTLISTYTKEGPVTRIKTTYETLAAANREFSNIFF